jgi:pimeloyl-ACP methyl ester carboxylesterase
MKHILVIALLTITIFSCQKERISTGTAINDVFYLKTEGQSLPVKVRGNIDSKKILIIVHGGPGGNAISYRTALVEKNVESQFAVVYFDQRFAGTTQGNGGSKDIATYKSDLKKLVDLIKSRYGANNSLYLMGHSWGGFLVPYFLIDDTNQDLFKGLIQVDGAHNYDRNDSLTRVILLTIGEQQIALGKNKENWQPIVDYCKAHAHNESAAVSIQLNSFASSVEAYISEVNPISGSISSLIVNPPHNLSTTAQLSNVYDSAFIQRFDRQTFDKPTTPNLYKLTLPTLLLWGKYDFVCPPELMDDIKSNISSSDVAEKVLQNSGHSPMNNEEVSFWTTLVDWVKTH